MRRSALFLCWLGLYLEPLLAGTPRAVLADGPGPWQDAEWALTATHFRGLLTEAGYAVTTMSPADPAFAHPAPDLLLAIPSLESLPFAAFTGIVAHVQAGGSLMASGGEPFRSALYLTSDGQWLDSAAYLRAAGSPPPQGAFVPRSSPRYRPPPSSTPRAPEFASRSPEVAGCLPRSGPKAATGLWAIS